MVLYSNPPENKFDKNFNTQFTPAETDQFLLKDTSYHTFVTPFCNDAMCPVVG